MTIESLTLPGPNFDPLLPPIAQAPGLDAGSFSFTTELDGHEIPEDVIVPVLPKGKYLSPYEAETGVVLPLVGPIDGDMNRHHGHFFEAAYLKGTDGQRAQRFSRVQLVDRDAHCAFHRRFQGTAFLEDERQVYDNVVLNCAGYFPEYGIRMKPSGPRIIELTERHRQHLRRPHILTLDRQQESIDDIGHFLLNYALDQDFSAAETLEVEEFLELNHADAGMDASIQARKIRLAERLTNMAIGLAVDPLNQRFSMAKRHEQLRKHAPPSAWEVVKQMVRNREPEYYDVLSHRLAEQFG